MVAMGIGRLGAPGIIIKRKFRYTIEIATPSGLIPRHFVKLGQRPQLDIEATEINFRNAVTWIPGKARWQPLTITYYDTTDGSMGPLYSWVASVYNHQQPAFLPMSEKCGWNATALIQMYDGCGQLLETWQLGSCWPMTIRFGDLDYANSEEATIELTLKFSEAIYIGSCGPSPAGICCGC